MALLKEITQVDGVPTTYHRILYLNHTVNSHNSIAVVSYVNEESRKNDLVANGENRPYRHAVTYELPYDESMTIETGYDYLKTLPAFEGAEDV